jgi:hypothetical protein
MNVDPDQMSVGIRQILAGLAFPAHRWQVIAQAQYYGAGSAYMVALGQLPPRIYHSVAEVTAHLHTPPQPPRRPRRPMPMLSLARHRPPEHRPPEHRLPEHRLPEPRAAAGQLVRLWIDS